MLKNSNKHEEQALFRSGTEDGIYWLFVIVRADGWAIRRNGVKVASGTAERVSLTEGIEKYLSLTRATAQQAIIEAPVVPQRSTESVSSFWENETVKPEGRGRPKAPKRSSASVYSGVAVS